MAVITDFATNLTAALNAIAASKIYTDIDAMYTEGRFQKDQIDKIIIAFHEKALAMAGGTAENIALKGYRIDEIIAKDLEVKDAEIAESTKNLEVKDAQILTEVERKLLITRQKTGFDDNVRIEKAKMLSDAIGMIQSGGNEAPPEFFTAWTTAIAAV